MFRENIGENLREIRKRYPGVSVSKVVDIMNEDGYEVSVDTYYKWERGTRKPPCEAIPYLAKALRTTESKIFHLHEHETNLMEKDTFQLLEELMQLPPEVSAVISWLTTKWEGDSSASLFFVAMYASMNKRDRSLISGLTIRLYEDAIKNEKLGDPCRAVDLEYTKKAWERLKNDAYDIDL